MSGPGKRGKKNWIKERRGAGQMAQSQIRMNPRIIMMVNGVQGKRIGL
jgi:hypothetical protein